MRDRQNEGPPNHSPPHLRLSPMEIIIAFAGQLDPARGSLRSC
jgi:hypothetical protein